MIYVASKTSHSALWKGLRDGGCPIISSWIDEAGVGESTDISQLWINIFNEINRCSGLILYAVEPDFPLKGALIEVGAALMLSKPVVVCLPGVVLEPRSYRPVGSWITHPLVIRDNQLNSAISWLSRICEKT